MLDNKDLYEQKRLEAYKFLDKNSKDFMNYFDDSLGVVYGIGGNMIASWITSTLKAWGYKILHFDLNFENKTLKEMDYRSMKKQMEGKKILLVRDGKLADEDRTLAQKIKQLGVNVKDFKLITTKPYKWYPLEELIFSNPKLI